MDSIDFKKYRERVQNDPAIQRLEQQKVKYQTVVIPSYEQQADGSIKTVWGDENRKMINRIDQLIEIRKREIYIAMLP